MYCLNCKKTFPDGLETCPHCNAPARPERCPECWVKLAEDEKICTKCGCDIERYLKEKEEKANYVAPTLKDKIMALPLWLRIAVPTALAVVIILITGALLYSGYADTKKAGELSVSFAEKTDEAMEMITEIANLYETEVYDKDWINHIENATKLREKYADKIRAVRKAREPITYANSLVADAGDEEIAALANDVYYSYTSCYAYVIGENGKYPHYLEKYKKLYNKYKEATERLRAEIE